MSIHNNPRGNPRMHGTLPDIEDYRFQTLDVPYDTSYDLTGNGWFWLLAARNCAEIWRLFGMEVHQDEGWKTRGAGEFKWPGKSPLGTNVYELVRKDSTGAIAGGDGWGQAADAWHPGDARDLGPWSPE